MENDPTFRPQMTYGQAVEQNHSLGRLPLATGAGLIAALVGGLLWALLAGLTHFKLGYAAVGVGFLTGWTMRAVARGHNPVYGYVGAGLALLGCVLGDVLSDCVFLAEQVGRPTLAVVSRLSPSMAVDLLKAGFQPLDALFYILAAWRVIVTPLSRSSVFLPLFLCAGGRFPVY